MVEYIFNKEETFGRIKILHFTLKNCSTEEANAIRRTILTKIPVIGIKDTKVLINESSFPSEMIVGRLESIYLNNKGLEERENVKFEIGCPDNVTLFDVESQMIKSLDSIAMPRMLIVSLKPSQRISVSFNLKKSNSMLHNHYSCASAVGFKLVEDKFIEGNVSTIAADKTYDMFIESTGVHDPVYILKTAINILIADFEKVRVTPETEAIRVTKIDETRIVVIIPNNQYTLSQTIACYLLMMDTNIIRAAGSKMPDQLQPNSEIHITGENPLENYHKSIDQIQSNLKNLLGQIVGEFDETKESAKNNSAKTKSKDKKSNARSANKA